MKLEDLKPGQIVEFVGDGDEWPINPWPVFDVPAREGIDNTTGEIDISVSDKFVVIECIEWFDESKSGRRLDVKILINGVVKYIDFEFSGIPYNEFRVVSN